MARSGPSSKWGVAVTVVFGLGALAFWVVGVGAGWRAWLLLDDLEPGRGIVAHAQAFGTDASVWWVTAAVLTLTTVVLALGTVALKHLTPAGRNSVAPVGGAEDGEHDDGAAGPVESDKVPDDDGPPTTATTTS